MPEETPKKRKIDMNNPWLVAIVVGIVFLIISSMIFKQPAFLYSPALINDFEDNNIEPNTKEEPVLTSAVFYIHRGGGAIARRCPEFNCEISHSFEEGESLKLPYSSIEDMPEWIDLSSIYEKDCFVHKSVFSTNPDAVLVTPSWEDRIARIACDSGGGSGLLALSEGKEAIITAKHIVETAELCQIFLPKQGYKNLDKKSFRLHEEHDLAIMLLGDFNNKDVKTLAKEPISVCQSGNKGDSVFVYGYPDAAKSHGVTMADGIISNIEENYYLTNANIGPGNSGGVVIKKEENCYLGIPVGVSVGTRTDSEGRVYDIENWGIILKATLLNYDEINGFSF